MTNTRNRRMFIALPIAAVAAVMAVSPSLAAVPAPTQPSPTVAPAPVGGATTQGIIMRDGGVCDPIRDMGC
jgi:hypothetical protein